MKQKEKKIIFDATTDKTINGFAVGISFLAIGVFLLLKPDYFFSPIASYIIGAFMGIIGFFGTGSEISKSSIIKGLDNLALGVVAFAGWFVMYIKLNDVWWNIPAFVLLIFGVYAICLGLIQSIFSIVNNIRQSKSDNKASHGKIFGQIILLLTQLCGLAIAILNVVKAVGL